MYKLYNEYILKNVTEQFHAVQSTCLLLGHTLENKQLDTKH